MLVSKHTGLFRETPISPNKRSKQQAGLCVGFEAHWPLLRDAHITQQKKQARGWAVCWFRGWAVRWFRSTLTSFERRPYHPTKEASKRLGCVLTPISPNKRRNKQDAGLCVGFEAHWPLLRGAHVTQQKKQARGWAVCWFRSTLASLERCPYHETTEGSKQEAGLCVGFEAHWRLLRDAHITKQKKQARGWAVCWFQSTLTSFERRPYHETKEGSKQEAGLCVGFEAHWPLSRDAHITKQKKQARGWAVCWFRSTLASFERRP